MGVSEGYRTLIQVIGSVWPYVHVSVTPHDTVHRKQQEQQSKNNRERLCQQRLLVDELPLVPGWLRRGGGAGSPVGESEQMNEGGGAVLQKVKG